MRPPHRPVDVIAPMEGGRHARESRICRENTSRGERPEVLDSTTAGPQIGGRPKRRGRRVHDSRRQANPKGGYLQAKSMARARIELATPRFSVVCSTD